jgi:hypothetical protein
MASITDDRMRDGTPSFWLDLGDEDGISDQRQVDTLNEAKEHCRAWLNADPNATRLVLHFARGVYELETTYTL